MFDWSKVNMPPEYPKPTYIVADNMVEAFREILRDRANVIPVSETYFTSIIYSGRYESNQLPDHKE